MDANGRIEGNARITMFDQLQWAISSPRRYFPGLVVLIVGFSALGIFLDYSNYGLVDIDTFLTISKAVIACFIVILIVSNACIMAFTLRLSAAQKEMTWVIDEKQIALHDATNTQVVIPWSIVKRFGVRKSGFLVELRPSGSRWIPARAFPEIQRSAIVEIAGAAGAVEK